MRFPNKALSASQARLQSIAEALSGKHPPNTKPKCMNLICFGYPGFQILEQKALSVKNIDDRLNVYIESLKMTAAFNNLTSLSAPQVGLNFRMFVMLKSLKGLTKFAIEKPRLPMQYRAFINPRIMELSELKDYGWETCSSFLDMKARILRPVSLTIDFYDEKLEIETEEFDGFSARVIQHEIDHLEGVNIINLQKNIGDFDFNEKMGEGEITENEKKYFENMLQAAVEQEKQEEKHEKFAKEYENVEKKKENFEEKNETFKKNNGKEGKVQNKQLEDEKFQMKKKIEIKQTKTGKISKNQLKTEIDKKGHNGKSK